MTVVRFAPRRDKEGAKAGPLRASDVFRRFFHLIERLEYPHRRGARHTAPEIKARISRFDIR